MSCVAECVPFCATLLLGSRLFASRCFEVSSESDPKSPIFRTAACAARFHSGPFYALRELRCDGADHRL